MRPRDSRLLIADSILADLDNAITHLELRKDVGNNRINKEAALAFKTRVALFEGSWQNTMQIRILEQSELIRPNILKFVWKQRKN